MASLKKYAAHKHLDAIYEFWFQLCEHVLRACEPSRYLGFGSVRRGGGELYVNIKKIEAITRIEGRRIGESLLSFLRSSVNEQVAVKRWIEHFPCLIQLKLVSNDIILVYHLIGVEEYTIGLAIS